MDKVDLDPGILMGSVCVDNVITLLSLISTSTSGSPNCLSGNSNWSVGPSFQKH